MRLSGFLVAAAMIASLGLPASAFAQSAGCEELRLACEHKGQLGERGAGDCRRYRETCERPRYSCRQLRYWCMHKDEFGGRGQGYCETYRSSCR